MKLGITMIVSDRPDELGRAIKSAEGLYDYLSVCLVKYNKMTKKKLKAYEDCRKVVEYNKGIISEYQVRPKWRYKFIDDFSTPRNMAIEALPDDCDWVLVVDSDDIIQAPKEIRSIVKALEIPSIVMISIVSDISKDKVSTAPIRETENSMLQIRLWSKGVALYKGRIHETPHYDFDKVSTVSIPEIAFLHHPNLNQVHSDRNTVLLDDVIKSGEHTARELFYYAETMYLTANQRKKGWEKMQEGAVKFFEELITDPELGAAMYKAFCYLADAEISKIHETKEGDFVKATQYVMNALSVSQLYPEPYYLMGKILYLSNYTRYALGWFRQAVEMPNTISVWHSSKNFKRSLPAESLGFAYMEIGDQERAIRYHTLARAMDKQLEINDEKFGI